MKFSNWEAGFKFNSSRFRKKKKKKKNSILKRNQMADKASCNLKRPQALTEIAPRFRVLKFHSQTTFKVFL